MYMNSECRPGPLGMGDCLLTLCTYIGLTKIPVNTSGDAGQLFFWFGSLTSPEV